MKKKWIGLSLMSMMALNIASPALAEEVSTSEENNSVTASAEQDQDNQESVNPASLIGEDGSLYMAPSGRSDLLPQVLSATTRATLPSVAATDNNTPSKSFIDVSSHNGTISVDQYRSMMAYGVTGVTVKLTEATSYRNPYAKSQIDNAKAAGLLVSTYHYSWFTSDAAAAAEADYYAQFANELGLDKSTVMINDMEEPNIAGKGDHTANSIAFANRLKQLGFNNTKHYIGLYWLTSGRVNGQSIGEKNIWVAAYPYTLTTTNYYTQYGAWQWSSQLGFPNVSGRFDISADYIGDYSMPLDLESPEGTTAMYRMYNTNSGEHFYTSNGAERNSLILAGWNYEGRGWNAPNEGENVYRLYNANAGDHHYTKSAAERDNLVAQGWKDEGISWRSGGETALHRLYNKNAKAGAHHYTLDTNERDHLVSNGWNYEGIGWYGN
ncbi:MULTISPECIES: GH25 family lysozyme [Enterococcus]|uniref:DUF5648 domain-containing protein n=1 Tax=Enterococcus alishanensis TaxID=1303817 RepID=A0ABS6TBT8_9ENTE|nr:GH25 family lysozyme [Enterococcus alishanensis]MBV7390359.1 hypothetical protein [Enterococcus alishanensis]